MTGQSRHSILGNPALLAAAALLVCIGGARTAGSCSCGMYNSFEDKLAATPYVFLGEVRSVTAKDEWLEDAGIAIQHNLYEFTVLQAWKGLKRRSVKIWVLQSMCGVEFELREKYIVYAGGTKRFVETDMCHGPIRLETPSGETRPEAAAELEALGEPAWRPRQSR